MEIRPERPGDQAEIAALVEEAFAGAEHISRTESAIVAQLREAGVLTLSLVAVESGTIIGHVAFSPVTIDGKVKGWFGLGPVAVAQDCQRQGTGSRLICEGLAELRQRGARGCVVVGAPSYYGRFGFRAERRLVYPNLPQEYFQALSFDEEMPCGTVAYHSAFG